MKKIYLILMCFWSGFACFASDLQSDINKTRRHFEDSKQSMADYLKDVGDVQLHFFWTTGFTLPDHDKYNPNREVHIGGKSYNQKFFPAVRAFLNNAPKKLKVKFVCDELTLQSNKEGFNALTNDFGDQFEILPINDVINNLLVNFPDHTEVINTVFRNATAGSPVLASDVYRLIGMYFGQKDPIGSLNNQVRSNVKSVRTYCDIDAFSDGMEHDTYQDMIKSLFEFVKIQGQSFIISRRRNNNDLIKVCTRFNARGVWSAHYRICQEKLSQIDIKSYVFDYYKKLHDGAKSYEENPKQNLDDIVPKIIKERLYEVMSLAGPESKFMDHKINGDIKKDLIYHSGTVGAWHTSVAKLDYNTSYGVKSNPKDAFSNNGLGFNKPDKFFNLCERYRDYLGAFLEMRRLGDGHPFNKAIKNYLKNDYPYHSQIFRDTVKDCFAFRQTETPGWEKYVKIFLGYIKEEDLVESYRGKRHYLALRSVLSDVGLTFPEITEKSLIEAPSVGGFFAWGV